MSRFLTFTALFALILLLLPQQSAAQTAYQTPPDALAALVEAPGTPAVSISPTRTHLLLLERAGLPTIAEMAEPELRLAGLRMNPNNYGPSRSTHFIGLQLKSLDGEEAVAISGIPENSRIRNVKWSPDGQHIAFSLDSHDHIALYVADVATRSAKQLIEAPLNDVYYSDPMYWMSDSKTLLIKTRPSNAGMPPAAPLAPLGPNIQSNDGEAAPARTYQDLLASPHDEAVFAHYLTTQLGMVTLDGVYTALGKPEMYVSSSPSPSGEYLYLASIHEPFSYIVPASRFPLYMRVVDRAGNPVHEIADLPLADDVPTAFGSVRKGPRSVSWRADKPATLYWTEAQDEGDAKKQVDIRDRVYTLDAPFDSSPVALVDLPLRYGGISWGNDDLAIVNEIWWSTRQRRMYRITPDKAGMAPELLFDVSMEDSYADPGFPLTQPTTSGRSVLLLDSKNNLYFTGDGASPEGDRPFVRQFNPVTKETSEIFRSAAPYYEQPIMFTDDKLQSLLTRRESNDVPPNYVLHNLRRNKLVSVTDFPHPYPHLTEVKKEILSYEREDGVQLNANLYTPPGYDKERDGPLPTLMWAYPREFKSAANAGQVTDSPYRFKSVSYWGAIPYVVQGYAVLDRTAMPVVGEGDNEPNDTFVDQLVMNADAAIRAGAATGAVDPNRVAIGGHSYGAFMTANLLAHSDLFRAGIARSGAYNRTLTPFGFQREERTFWEAPEIYFAMSPFMHAHKIDEPILLIHGEADNNSGTFPLQSRRLYSALKGHGGTARLVMLPHESHGYRAKESLLHMLWETNNWLEKHVKPEASVDNQVAEPVGDE